MYLRDLLNTQRTLHYVWNRNDPKYKFQLVTSPKHVNLFPVTVSTIILPIIIKVIELSDTKNQNI